MPFIGEISTKKFNEKYSSGNLVIDLRQYETGLLPKSLDNLPSLENIMPEILQTIQGRYIVTRNLESSTLNHFVPSYQAMRNINTLISWLMS